MKLRNKKTGEIRDTEKWVFSVTDSGVLFGDTVYNSLAELCKEWEDYEEPTDKIENIWTGNRREKTVQIKCNSEKYAKEVFKKLKAWERLKITSDNCSYRYVGTNESRSGIDSFEYEIHTSFDTVPDEKDLDLIFGCEE